MKAPDKIYVLLDKRTGFLSHTFTNVPCSYESSQDIEYIRKDTVDEMIKTAEDHAYFAGQEKLREKLMEWAQEKLQEKHAPQFRDAIGQLIDKLNLL